MSECSANVPSNTSLSLTVTEATRHDFLKKADLTNLESVHDLVTVEVYIQISSFCALVIIPVIFLVGIPTNVVTCLVFYRQGWRDRMNLCLSVHALVDIACITLVSLQSAKNFVDLVDVALGMKYNAKVLLYLGYPVLATKAILSCINVVIAVERCVCVVFPLRAGTIMRTRTMALLLATIVVFMFLAHIFFPLKYDIAVFKDESTGLQSWIVIPSRLFLESAFVFYIIDDIIISTLLPVSTFLVVTAATTLTVVRLRLALAWRAEFLPAKERESPEGRGNLELPLIRTLILLSCVYIACSTPFVLVSLARVLVPGFISGGCYHNTFWTAHCLATTMFVVNCAVSFFLYWTRARRFRKTLRDMWLGHKKSQATHWASSRTHASQSDTIAKSMNSFDSVQTVAMNATFLNGVVSLAVKQSTCLT